MNWINPEPKRSCHYNATQEVRSEKACIVQNDLRGHYGLQLLMANGNKEEEFKQAKVHS
jgi:hypothetical protein